ncbi:hypothetical protein [Chryseobacterium sp. c4a]|uniref:hypothetical protein n=1 Tax=Chryseobacterium sp. c4a TaxID=1573582 RepID=UPI001357331A|nr:hypothetical protein [Chryseobacterium sp. c4a]
MFKKIDTALLLRFPLLWNTKFPYMVIVGLLFHVLAFLIGFWFQDFGKDLRDKNFYFYKNRDLATAGTGIIGCVILLVWFLFYIRNNAFKSFYPKKKNDLFKEWLIVYIMLTFFSMAFFTVRYGSRYAAISVFSQEELKKKAELAYKGRLLLLNDDYTKDRQQIVSQKGKTDSTTYTTNSDVFEYKDRLFPWNSMIANHDFEMLYSGSNLDSLYTDQVRMLYYKSDSVQIKKTLDAYFALLKEHHLETNVTTSLWFEYFYNEPLFVSNVYIDDRSGYTSSGSEEFSDVKKLYVDSYLLKDYYGKIINSSKYKIFDDELLLVLVYLALSLSTVVITFRVSTMRQWVVSLITVLLLAVVNAGLLGLTGDYFTDFKNFLIALFAELIIFLLLVFVAKYRKNVSAIALNVLVLGFPFVILCSAAICYKVFIDLQDRELKIPYRQQEFYYHNSFLRDAAIVNCIIVFIVLLLLLRLIRNRKALPGN